MKGKLSRVVPFALLLLSLGTAFLTVSCGSSTVRYRFVLASTSVPTNVDLQVDGKIVQSAVGYNQSASYHTISSGSHKFALFATGTTTSPYLSADVSLDKGDTTLIAENPFANMSLNPYTDDNTVPTTGNAKLRVINASPSVPSGICDVYIVQTGQGIAGQSPQLPNFAFQTASSYQTLAAGGYDIVVTVNGTQTIIASLINLNLESGKIRTVVILDQQTGGGPFQILLLTDL
jgi:hypothetical protein